MAKRFVFRFETMLKIRRQREDQHKRVVAERLSQISARRESLGRLDRQIIDEVNAIRASQEPGKLDIQQTMRHRHWLGHLHKGVLEEQSKVRFLEARLAQERAVLAEAVKQRRILEKLKERQYQRHVTQEEKRETLELDEMATMRYVYDGHAATPDGGERA
jgi:flagellar protein FliJ